ncbi:methyltransferase domain-containing protein [Plantibacter sp. YIM 135347]|uniref:class I SAM-dependent methyltransferase n=1 Tax=Plantibacter sp. YIM 135347 TaxID=3423919 RepID=UPI003D32EB60
MVDGEVRAAYVERAAEYIDVLGSVEQLSELDRQRIGDWSASVDGLVIDAGCGPGHWTDFLARRGVRVLGVDLVPDFIASARERFPGVPFVVGSLREPLRERLCECFSDASRASLRHLRERDDIVGSDGAAGILAWYSLIHLPPEELPPVLASLARELRPRGRLLLGFFEGEAAEPFAHAITTAYFWSVERMSEMLGGVGFDVIDVETRRDDGARPHASLSAILRQASVPGP